MKIRKPRFIFSFNSRINASNCFDKLKSYFREDMSLKQFHKSYYLVCVY